MSSNFLYILYFLTKKRHIDVLEVLCHVPLIASEILTLALHFTEYSRQFFFCRMWSSSVWQSSEFSPVLYFLICDCCLLHCGKNLKSNNHIIRVAITLISCALLSQNKLTLKCTTTTPIVLNASPDFTTPYSNRQSLWLHLININEYAKFHENIASSLPCQ